MTWTQDDCLGHVGAVIGLARMPLGDPRRRFGDHFRELTEADPGPTYPDAVQLACTCGWRSPRMEAPIDCCWWATGLDMSEWFDQRGYAIWRAHARATVFGEQEAKARANG